VTAIEWASWTPLIAGMVVLGLVPGLVFGVTNDAVSGLMKAFGG
jgi:NADH:ubiquinone oxidoreductase subunit 4 (subunit M)